jgi:UDP-GlcNAc:undecaprenyl-phosphate GlcNAc-1-phosphate transferase
MSTVAIAAVALVVTVAATPLAMVAARRLGIVDHPGALKPQAAAVPYLGGVAVFVGVVVGAGAGHPAVLVPLGLALVLGVADDRADLPALFRLVGQLAVGVAVVVTCPVHLPGGLGAVALVVVTVLVINGVNLIDGLDALASGVGVVAAVAFGIVLHGAGRQVSVALAAALVGFLAYNRPPARVYLGDGGSYLLGTTLTVLLADAWSPGVRVATGVAALALVAVPVAEVAFAMVRRVRSGRSVLAGDRGHPYDRLVARGWTAPSAVLAYVAVEAVLATGVVIAAHLHSTPAAVTVDVVAAVSLVLLALASGALAPDLGVST